MRRMHTRQSLQRFGLMNLSANSFAHWMRITIRQFTMGARLSDGEAPQLPNNEKRTPKVIIAELIYSLSIESLSKDCRMT